MSARVLSVMMLSLSLSLVLEVDVAADIGCTRLMVPTRVNVVVIFFSVVSFRRFCVSERCPVASRASGT